MKRALLSWSSGKDNVTQRKKVGGFVKNTCLSCAHATRNDEQRVRNRSSLRSVRDVPQRMRRPSTARKALGLSPLVQARRTHAACLKGIPRMTALTEPVIFLAGRPAAERAADARSGGIVALFFIEFAIQNN